MEKVSRREAKRQKRAFREEFGNEVGVVEQWQRKENQRRKLKKRNRRRKEIKKLRKMGGEKDDRLLTESDRARVLAAPVGEFIVDCLEQRWHGTDEDGGNDGNWYLVKWSTGGKSWLPQSMLECAEEMKRLEECRQKEKAQERKIKEREEKRKRKKNFEKTYFL